MEFKEFKNERGFKGITFEDRYDECVIQESSLDSGDGEKHIWFGLSQAKPEFMIKEQGWFDYPLPTEVKINTQMHLSQSQVKELIPILTKFAETGEL